MIVLVAVMLMAIIAILGLVLDSGRVHAARRQARRAADAAAQAGAFVMVSGTNSVQTTLGTSTAIQYASTNGIDAANVVVQIPPGAGSNSIFVGSNGYIFVQVTLPVNTTFLRLFSTQQTVNVTAAATAGLLWGMCPLSVVVLNPSMSDALKVNGGAEMTIPGGTIGVNSTASNAVDMKGGSSLTCNNLIVVGNVSGTVNANLQTGARVIPDPFAWVPAPAITSSSQVTYGDGATAGTSPDSGGTAASPSAASPSGTVTMHPGIYWGGIKINGGNITFQPGRYVIAGGGFSISGSPTVLGTNCFFYNTCDPYSASSGGAYSSIGIAGSSSISLKAPTTSYDSTYGGFLFMNDRASSQIVTLSGGSSSSASAPLSGFIYAKASQLKITGGGYLGGLGAIVDSMDVSGNSNFTALDVSRVPGVATAGLME